jgi:murein DD-endopeptidase MepM/ murein hydrolase activator NlpD
VAGLTIGAGAATADGTGGSGDGGVGVPDPPKVKDVRCVETCGGLRVATVGSRVEVIGRRLRDVVEVRFRAEAGGRIGVAPRRVSSGFVRARVPEGATSGEPKVVDDYGGRGVAPVRLRLVDPDAIPDELAFRAASASVSPETAYFAGKVRPALTYAFEGSETNVRIEVVRRDSHRVVRSWVDQESEPFVDNRVAWNGRRQDGRVARNGKYAFRIGPAKGGASERVAGSGFAYYDHIFPVRARHDYWDGFGAGRGHQGQDVGAACGEKIVAARGGRVTWKRYHSAAGYYVVIDGRRDSHDYMYAHLRKPAIVGEGERVRTGERIGRVGATGNATGCHLHFEYWSSHWWAGGRPLPSVTRVLRKWDGWS